MAQDPHVKTVCPGNRRWARSFVLVLISRSQTQGWPLRNRGGVWCPPAALWLQAFCATWGVLRVGVLLGTGFAVWEDGSCPHTGQRAAGWVPTGTVPGGRRGSPGAGHV